MATTERDKRRQLASAGVASGATWGGPGKRRYFAPDGREVWSTPAMRDFVRRDAEGKVIEEGVRDANLDRGWTMSPPTQLMIHCRACDKYHWEEEEVASCMASRKAAAQRWEDRAKTMRDEATGGGTEQFDERLGDLETAVGEVQESIGNIETMLKALLARG